MQPTHDTSDLHRIRPLDRNHNCLRLHSSSTHIHVRVVSPCQASGGVEGTARALESKKEPTDEHGQRGGLVLKPSTSAALILTAAFLAIATWYLKRV